MKNYNKLDVAAKIFPSITNKSNSSVFRVSVVLKHEVDPHYLQLAVNMIQERFSVFFLRMRKGVFWNYFDNNHGTFRVLEDSNSPCETILSHENDGYIIKVLYYKNRISIEAFHSITDGSGVMEFLKSLLYYYICFKYGNIDSQNKIMLFDETNKNDTDSFTDNFKNFDKKQLIKTKEPKSFIIKGKKFRNKGNSVVSGTISVKDIKSQCKKYNCTITAYLTAIMIFSIYDCKQKNTKNNKPIIIAVPVNLRKLFSSDTVKNFFGVVKIGYKVTEFTKLNEIIESVKEQLNSTINTDFLSSASAKNVIMSENVFSASIPLVVKNMILPIGFNLMGENKKTITISNIGQFNIPDGIKSKVEHIEVMPYPTPKSPISCGVCSFEDNLVISFIRSIKDVQVVRNFFLTLSKEICSDINVYSNNWGDIDEKMQTM